MDVYQLLTLQLIAHVIADFYLQNDLWARHKKIYGIRSKIMYLHAFIVFVTTYIFSFQLSFIMPALFIFLIHLGIDLIKKHLDKIKIRRKPVLKNISFAIDQALHIITICFVVFWFSKNNILKPVIDIPINTNQLIIILAYLICIKPTNVFIKEIISVSKINIPKSKDDLINAGRLIGNIERILTITLLLTGRYEAIGFIIAAKSILRFEGGKSNKTEYVLIGSFLSFGIAILIGIVILNIKI